MGTFFFSSCLLLSLNSSSPPPTRPPRPPLQRGTPSWKSTRCPCSGSRSSPRAGHPHSRDSCPRSSSCSASTLTRLTASTNRSQSCSQPTLQARPPSPAKTLSRWSLKARTLPSWPHQKSTTTSRKSVPPEPLASTKPAPHTWKRSLLLATSSSAVSSKCSRRSHGVMAWTSTERRQTSSRQSSSDVKPTPSSPSSSVTLCTTATPCSCPTHTKSSVPKASRSQLCFFTRSAAGPKTTMSRLTSECSSTTAFSPKRCWTLSLLYWPSSQAL